MAEKILIVDKDDNVLGTEDKEKCHDGNGILHRAFVVIVFNSKGQVLITKRSKEKRLWPGYLEASIASHVRENETYESAAERRLLEELAIRCKAEYKFKFQYQAKYMDEGSENEICAVLFCKTDEKIMPNPKEISEAKFVNQNELQSDNGNYSPWTSITLQKLKSINI